jgi:hypothetical protein
MNSTLKQINEEEEENDFKIRVEILDLVDVSNINASAEDNTSIKFPDSYESTNKKVKEV